MLKSDDERAPLRTSLPEVTNELGSHLYLYQILEETPNGVMVVSLDHQVLYANRAANQLFGVEYRHITDTGLENLLGEENRWFYYQIGQFFDNLSEMDRSKLRHEIEITTGENRRKILDAVLTYPPSSPEYYLMYLIDTKLEKFGFSIGNPREDNRRGGHVALVHEEALRINEALKAAKVVPDFRYPNVIRLAPVPLYVSFQDVYELVSRIEDIMEHRKYEKYEKKIGLIA